eukprot:GHVU01221409.1.p1 GENE.GHVU01221409.1~~GHVU01221409.1.p1  ORF type:complete len:149 (-),score=11.61 GHVU01221409.1:284-730(-)
MNDDRSIDEGEERVECEDVEDCNIASTNRSQRGCMYTGRSAGRSENECCDHDEMMREREEVRMTGKRTDTPIYTHTLLHTRTCAHRRTHSYTHTHIRTHTHTPTHTHTRTYAHTHRRGPTVWGWNFPGRFANQVVAFATGEIELRLSD